ncbi:cupin domain-containing protein [Streptomyces sp. RB6PN25]|uniref:Cupin domain-containing protein n=1 Tax=Streptomyces humicola TaxID=2953240 RepID=A0ABT1PPM5_9ACTN|nr:cupin domain-containing protein [Streptomyces humicola]MCQ4079637.1 cupin domain-containing protein [Streptomyces humicola]
MNAGFPGATAVSHLRVYDWPAADGLRGGSPHLHTVSAEGYVVLGGEGELETLGSHGYARTELRHGTLLWFTPGTVHRLVNVSGDLEILVVMQNAGLPEAGDAVLTFPADVLADPGRYAEAVALPATAADHAAAARRRRDLAVEGYLELRERVVKDGPEQLRPLHEAAARLVAPRAEDWRGLWRRGAAAQAERTGARLDALAQGHAPHLAEAALTTAEQAPALRYGMCGRLQVWDLEGARMIR